MDIISFEASQVTFSLSAMNSLNTLSKGALTKLKRKQKKEKPCSLCYLHTVFLSELCIQVPHEKPQRGEAIVNQHLHWYLHFLECGLSVAVFNLDSKTLIQSQGGIFTMVRSNLNKHSGLLPWYKCGCWFTQCKRRETTVSSQVSPTTAKKSCLCYGPE